MTAARVPATDTLESVAARIRSHVVDMCAGPEGGHLGGAFSCVDVLTALYFSVLNVDPGGPEDPDRDRCPAWRCPPARSATASHWPAGSRSPPGTTGATRAASCSSATASSRRVRCG